MAFLTLFKAEYFTLFYKFNFPPISAVVCFFLPDSPEISACLFWPRMTFTGHVQGVRKLLCFWFGCWEAQRSGNLPFIALSIRDMPPRVANQGWSCSQRLAVAPGHAVFGFGWVSMMGFLMSILSFKPKPAGDASFCLVLFHFHAEWCEHVNKNSGKGEFQC